MFPRIPSSLRTDRPTILLVTQRRNLLERYAICSKRVNWTVVKDASLIERRRTRERGEIHDRLRTIEAELMANLARDVRHPDLSFHSTIYPRRYVLIAEWLAAKRIPAPTHPKRSELIRQRTATRHRIAQELQDLDDRWLSALTRAIFPRVPLPPRRFIHVRAFKP
jgi:hypothetical protein